MADPPELSTHCTAYEYDGLPLTPVHVTFSALPVANAATAGEAGAVTAGHVEATVMVCVEQVGVDVQLFFAFTKHVVEPALSPDTEPDNDVVVVPLLEHVALGPQPYSYSAALETEPQMTDTAELPGELWVNEVMLGVALMVPAQGASLLLEVQVVEVHEFESVDSTKHLYGWSLMRPWKSTVQNPAAQTGEPTMLPAGAPAHAAAEPELSTHLTMYE